MVQLSDHRLLHTSVICSVLIPTCNLFSQVLLVSVMTYTYWGEGAETRPGTEREGGRGSQKSKLLIKGKYETKPEFPEGWVQTPPPPSPPPKKKHLWGECGMIFLKQYIIDE